MSRVGALPVSIPSGVEVKVEGLNIIVSGKKGAISKSFNGDINMYIEDEKVLIRPLNDLSKSRAIWGTARSIIANMVRGVSEGFSTELEIIGVGYRAIIKDGYINLALGKSHNTKISIPNGLEISASTPNKVLISSFDKELLGQFIAQIIKQRPPEPYKGKGIKKVGQYVQRKESKKK
jgi:large subunit ribosomal protein L6